MVHLSMKHRHAQSAGDTAWHVGIVPKSIDSGHLAPALPQATRQVLGGEHSMDSVSLSRLDLQTSREQLKAAQWIQMG